MQVRVAQGVFSPLFTSLLLGVNASDINYSNGKYLPGKRPPLEAGFEGRQRYPDVAEEIGKPVMSLTKQFEKGVGEVVAVGSEVKRPSVGDAVAVWSCVFANRN